MVALSKYKQGEVSSAYRAKLSKIEKVSLLARVLSLKIKVKLQNSSALFSC